MTIQPYKLLGLANLAVNKLECRLQLGELYSMPLEIDLVLTRACNLECIYCRDYNTRGQKSASDDDLASVARQLFPTARKLSICSGGEPYLHPGLERVLRLAKHYGLITTLASNGTVFREELVRTILQERLVSLHVFSMDGNEPATVAKLRIHATLDRVVDTVGHFVKMRSEISPGTPKIRISYVLMRSTIEELPAAVERWGNMGIDLLWCHYLGVANGIDPKESLFFHQDLMKTVFKEARAVAAKFPNLALTLPVPVEDEIARKTNPTPCHAPWQFVMIDTDGTVLGCYEGYEGLQMGRLYGEDATPFRTIWNNDAYRALRGTVNRPGLKFFNYCSRCEIRYGYGDVGTHLLDQAWTESLREQGNLVHIDHRRHKTAV